MATALLIVDLEGVAGVDHVDALFAGSPDYPFACRLLTDEVEAAVEALCRAGFDRVVISDSHESGAAGPNVDADRLRGPAEVVRLDDAYAKELLACCDAVACLGMHAAAGTRGFAAHTVSVHCAWECDGRNLSELDLVLALAAERNVPFLFASGDDVLGASVPGVRFVRTKRSLSGMEAESRHADEVRRELQAAAASPPTRIPVERRGPILLRFKSRWKADIAETAGAERADECTVRVRGDTFTDRYCRALELVFAAAAPLADAMRGQPGSPIFREDAAVLLGRSFERRPLPPLEDAARSALAGFLQATVRGDEFGRALRALTLHMLEAHAPGFFARCGLGPMLRDALVALEAMPVSFTPWLHPDLGMARLDALYVLREQGRPRDVRAPEFDAWLDRVWTVSPLHAWLMSALGEALGLCRARKLPPEAMASFSREEELYWLTHLYLLETRYLRKVLPRPGWEARAERVLLASRWAVEGRRVDLGAELAFCLQLSGEETSEEHHRLLELLLAHQLADGTVRDPTPRQEGRDPEDIVDLDAHTTAAALVALAGAAERALRADPAGGGRV